jgi:spermidine synthase
LSAGDGAFPARPDSPGGPGRAARIVTRAVPLLYFLSGVTGLGYEVLWARMFTAEFGLSIFGVAATVAAYLLGLGAGAILAARLLEPLRPSGPIRWTPPRALGAYALLELAVALYAMALPAIAAIDGPWIDAGAIGLGWWQWCALQGLLALVLLGLPAAAIGASFPLVLRALPWRPSQVGRIYAINALGAATGALSSLALLAAGGWDAALRSIAWAGIAIAAAAFLLSRSAGARALPGRGHAQREETTAASARGVAPTRRPLAQLLAYGGVGACAIMLEIGWTRLYGMVMLRTEYVLAIILAVYLAGTALGSALAARARTPMAIAVPLAACAGALLGLWALAPLSAWLQNRQFDSLMSALAVQACALAVCTLPVTIALGAWLPLLARRMPIDARQYRWAALLYGANCLGGAIGALLTVAVAVPALGATGTIALAAVALLVLGMTLSPPRPLVAALPLAILAAGMLRNLPPPSSLLGSRLDGTVVRYQFEDALSLNHVIEMPDGQRTLLTDLQHMDAASDPAAVAVQADQARLPLLLHPDPRSVLFLGLGTGITASGSLPWPALVRTAVEISPGAVVAARDWFAPVSAGITERLRIVHDDARHFLAAGTAPFDVIVGDLFHPDLAGTGNLLSVEQFARARARLSRDGVFVQWLAVNQFDRESLRIVLRSFQRVFPSAKIFLDGAHLAMVGTLAPLPIAPAMQANLRAIGPDAADPATGGEGAATWLGRYWGPIAAGVGAVQRESRPVIEFQLPRLRYEDSGNGAGGGALQAAPPVAGILLELLRQRPDAARAARELGVAPADREAFDNAYLASELAVQAWLSGMAGDERRARQIVRLGFEANPRDRWIADNLADDLVESARQDGSLEQPGTLERILRIFPDNLAAVRALWHRERDAGNPDAGQALARLHTLAPLDREGAAIGVRSP